MTTFILIILLFVIIYKLTQSSNGTLKSSVKKPVKIKYKCQDCGYSFSDTQNLSSCPKCSSNVIDELATMAGIYMLGDWLGFWGDDVDDLSSSSDSFSDPWHNGSDAYDDVDEY